MVPRLAARDESVSGLRLLRAEKRVDRAACAASAAEAGPSIALCCPGDANTAGRLHGDARLIAEAGSSALQISKTVELRYLRTIERSPA